MPKETEPGCPGQDFRFLDDELAKAQEAERAGDLMLAGRHWARCVNALETHLVNAASVQCRDLQSAQDAFQDTCLYIFERLETLNLQDVSAYVRFKTVMSCRLKDIFRKRNRKSFKLRFYGELSTSDDGSSGFDPEDPKQLHDGPGRSGLSSRDLLDLESFVTILSTFDRKLLRYRCHGMTYEEIRTTMPTDWDDRTLSRRTRRLIRDYRRFLGDEENLKGKHG